MFAKCPSCGKVSLTLFRSVTSCRGCGAQWAAAAPRGPDAPIQFPSRRGHSLEDGLARQQREGLESKAVGTHYILVPWSDVLKKRPHDVPLYTALKGRATVALVFSSDLIPSAKIVARVLSGHLPLGLQVEAFVDGPYPVLRCNLVFPDNPSDPCIVECGLDVAGADAQDFLRAASQGDQLDVIVGHEAEPGGTWAVDCEAAGLGRMVRNEVARVLRGLRPGATEADFRRSVLLMEQKFPSGAAGVSPSKSTMVRVAGEARNRLIEWP